MRTLSIFGLNSTFILLITLAGCSSNVKSYSSEKLGHLFENSLKEAFSSKEKKYTKILEEMFHELADRNKHTESQISYLYKHYVQYRLFDKARKLKDQFPHTKMEEIPKIYLHEEVLKSRKPKVFDINKVQKTLSLKALNLDQDRSIVVISHPNCHFSRNAITAIKEDPLIGKVFAQKAHFIAPQDGTLNIEAFAEWNKKYPQFETHIAYYQSEFKNIDTWATPTFYFIHKGRVVHKIEGWPSDKRKTQLAEAIKKLNMKN